MNSALVVIILQILLTFTVFLTTFVVFRLYEYGQNLSFFTEQFVYSLAISSFLGGLVFLIPTVAMLVLNKIAQRFLGVMFAVGFMLAEAVSMLLALLLIVVVALQSRAIELNWPVFIITLMMVGLAKLFALVLNK